MKKLFILFIAVAGFGVTTFAQNSATVSTATATSKIIKPITLSLTSSLEFGTISVGLGGSVAISAADVVNAIGPVLYTGGATRKAAIFSLNGESSMTYHIDLPADNVIVLKTGAGDVASKQMNLTGFVSDASLTLTGSATPVKVGAVLHVSATQTPGDYTTTFPVTVAYN